jgi:xanthine dehydrogenase YagS FAD-binding subunit
VRPFHYSRAADPQEAVALLERTPGARFLGGGTNLVDLMRLGVEAPPALVDVTALGAGGVSEIPGGGLRIGASVRNSELAADPLVRERYPVLAQALLDGASGQLRNLATTGGNLLQRTRCAYFMEPSKPCNKRSPGSGCPARTGETTHMAIFGHSEHCVAVHPSDMAVALAALDATVHVLGAGGERAIPIGELHRLPGESPERDTTLAPGELITAVELPPLPAARRSRYRKVRERRSFAFALVSLAAAVEVRGGAVADVRLALGGVAHAPWRATRAEAVLQGREPTAELARQAADAELERARPLEGNAYKCELVRNLIVDAVGALAGAPA